MTEKERALGSAVTGPQGNSSYKAIIQSHSDFVKSDWEKKREYFSNAFTRFKLLGAAQELLLKRYPDLFNNQYTKCHRVSLGSLATLVHNPQKNSAYYNSVATCSNAIYCPVCAPRIMGVRSAEVRQAVHQWLGESPDNTCYMITFTFAHKITDALSDLLDSFSKARKKFWERGDLKRLLKSSGRVGRITATEIQFSQKNGFHPHQHVLLFCKKTDFDEIKLAHYWLDALSACGLSGLREIGFTIIEARSAEKYLTKISSEMTMGNLKQGRLSGHYSPMQLLGEVINGESWAADRFCEFFFAVRGLHVLEWSPKLKARFGIGELSDESITAGAGQPELVQFMDIFGPDFNQKLSSSNKALLRGFAAYNDWHSAAALLDRIGVEYWQEYRYKKGGL